jgi:hypothetical protein
MTVAAHAEIMAQIERIMNNAGYFSNKQIERSPDQAGKRKHGFDLSKFVPNSLFYAPCQAGPGGIASSRISIRTAAKPSTLISTSTRRF